MLKFFAMIFLAYEVLTIFNPRFLRLTKEMNYLNGIACRLKTQSTNPKKLPPEEEDMFVACFISVLIIMAFQISYLVFNLTLLFLGMQYFILGLIFILLSTIHHKLIKKFSGNESVDIMGERVVVKNEFAIDVVTRIDAMISVAILFTIIVI